MKKIIGYYRKCDLLTMTGTLSSFIGLLMTLNGHYTITVFLLIIAGLCDAFDGCLARSKKYDIYQKTYGAQLDSISDVVCFGVLPAFLTSAICNNIIAYIISIFYMLCGVVRLSYFNMLDVTKSAKPKTYRGIPITSVTVVYPVIFLIVKFINSNYLKVVLPILLLILGLLFIIDIEYPKLDIPKIFKKIFNDKVINLLIFPMLIIILSDLIFKFNYSNILLLLSSEFTSLIKYILPTITIYLFITLIFIILTSIFNKVRISSLILIITSAIINIINDIKFHIMGSPIELSDINYLNIDNMGMMNTASKVSIGSWIWLTIIKTIIFIIILLLIYLIQNNNKVFSKMKSRLLVFIMSIVIFITLIFTISNNPKYMIEKIYRTNINTIMNYTSISDAYKKYGFYQGLLLNSIGKTPLKPNNYSKSNALSIIESHKDDKSNDWKKANIVFILSESFSDLTNDDDIVFDKDIMPNIHSYENDSDKLVLDLIVPTYGGGSVNTEFEILTGLSMNFFQYGFIPYTEYYNDTNVKYIPNIIKELNNNNYETMYLTPWGSSSFKSSYVYSLFGVDRKVYDKDLNGKVKGIYYSDESLMNDIYNELKDTSEGNYKFIMAATGQNHYPYSEDKYDNYDINVLKTKLNKEDTSILHSYAQGIYDADKELNNLYNMIQDLNTPTIIVFFGDHLPFTVNSDSDEAYMKCNYFNTNSIELNNIRKYTTKAVMLSNYGIKFDNIQMMNSNYLGSYIINNMDLNVSNYFKYIESMRKSVPIFNRTSIYVDSKNDNVNKLLNDYRNVEYSILYDYE